MNTLFPQDQTFWYLKKNGAPPLRHSIETDVVVIGGGMAGITAAQAFSKKGKKVVLLEKNYCGAGASGKSSGFITPNSELAFADMERFFTRDIAERLWAAISAGVATIKNNIDHYNLACDYVAQDTLVLANSAHALKKLKKEHEDLSRLGYTTFYFDKAHVPQFVNSSAYCGGMGYGDSFGINSYLYCQEMKKVLSNLGIHIYEETPVLSIKNNTAQTDYATVTAKHIIVCADRFIPQFTDLSQQVYAMQTFILLSEVLQQEQIAALFPNKQYMCWDTDLIYTYFRVTGTNRLIVGGGNMWTTYTTKEDHNYHAITKKLINYVQKKFPNAHINFEYQWPGLIGISKDIMPIAGHDKENKHIYYAGAAAGLPISAAIGAYSADHIVDSRTDLDTCFSPYRSFPVGNFLQTFLGHKVSFALSNFIKLKW